MGTPKRGQKVALLLGFLFAVLVAVLAFVNRTELRAWYLLWREFECLEKNAQGYPEYRHRETGIVFVRLPAGEFYMGMSKEEFDSVVEETVSDVVEELVTNSSKDVRKMVRVTFAAGQPQHKVTLSPFLIAKYEVTQAQWNKVMGENPLLFKSDNLPIQGVSWEDCKEFSKRTGLSLPTEAEWEYACRAGTQGPFGGTGKLDDMGWSDANSGGKPHVVGQKEPNGFGLYDMHGNVLEWCEDVYDPDFYKRPEASQKNPVCVSGSEVHVLRGGSYSFPDGNCRSAFRLRDFPPVRMYFGFRPSKPLP